MEAIENYNKKEFLAKESITSMGAIFCKKYDDGIAIVRISDCHRSIKLWNNLNEIGAKEEMLEKLETLERNIIEFKIFIKNQ